MKTKLFLSIISPIFNEISCVDPLLEQIFKVLIPSIRDDFSKIEVIIGEDGSTDGTAEKVRELRENYSYRLVQGAHRKGYQRAVLDLYRQAQGDLIFFLDSDLQHDIRDFALLYNELSLNNCDMVIGFKQIRHDPLIRRLISRLIHAYVRLLCGTNNLHDMNCGFRLVRRTLTDQILDQIRYVKYGVSLEMTVLAVSQGYVVHEVVVEHLAREGGSAIFTVNRIPRIMRDTLFGIYRLSRTTRRLLPPQGCKD